MRARAELTRVLDARPGRGELFIAALETVLPAELSARGIVCLLVLAAPDALLAHIRQQLPALEVLVFAVEDAECADISRFFFEAAFHLQQRLARGQSALLVSRRGLSRAPTIAAAFLIRHAGLSAAQALRLLRRRLPALAINEGFHGQLLALERFTRAALPCPQ